MTKRLEFTASTIKRRLEFCGNQCEGILADGTRCKTIVSKGRFHVDHLLPARLGGDNSFGNARINCIPCHAEKTHGEEAKTIAKQRRVERKELRAKQDTPPKRKIESRGFPKSDKPRTEKLPMPPRRNPWTGETYR